MLCLAAALLAAVPLAWVAPAAAAGTVVLGHGDNRGPGGGADRDEDQADDDDDRHDDVPAGVASAPAAPTAGAPGAAAGASPAAPGPAAVTIAGDAFSPASLSVIAGSPVTWTNRDGDEHTATADGRAFDSGSLAGGKQFTFTFATPGSFAYFCAFHADMRGTVTVAAAGGSAQPAADVATAPSPPTSRATMASPPSATAAGQDASVEMRDYEFSPAKLTVGRGTEVTFRNVGNAPHTATSTSFDSGEISAGQTFAQRFDAPGTFEYRCELHPRMIGAIEVVANASAAPKAGTVDRFPIERTAAGAIVGAPLILVAAAVFMWVRR